MNRPHTSPTFWSTASFGDTTDTSPAELSDLGDHMDSCRGTQGRWFALRCTGEVLNRFIAARFVTTVVVATVLIGGAALVL